MKKTSFLINCQFLTILVIILSAFLTPIIIHAGTFYNCTDNRGTTFLSDNPVDGLDCKEIQTREETTSAKEESKKSNKEESDISYSSNKATRVTVIGNKVFVPVTFVYENNEASVNLVLDTGASGTTIHDNVASQLYVNLNNAQKAKGRVVGGGTIDANMITMNSVKVGPYTFYKRNIFVIPYEDPPSNYDGLLGMDLLQEMNYKLDLGKQAIIWE